MRSRRPSSDQVAEVAQRRLEQLHAELAAIRPAPDAVDAARPATTEPPERREPVLDEYERPEPGRHAYRPVGRGQAVGAWLQDRLPATMQGRVALGVSQLLVVLLVAAVGVGATVWWVARSDGDSTAVPPVESTPTALAALPSPSVTGGGRAPLSTPEALVSGSPDSPEGGTLVVDVAGKVRRPGIATLPLGSRVVDALEAAGGARKGVALGSLNLARVLVDGEQVVVGLPAPTGVAASAASSPSSGSGAGSGVVPMVNVNTAAQAELEELPGIGPVTAAAILEYRSQNGSFTAVDDLLEVSGIGEVTLAEIAPHVTL